MKSDVLKRSVSVRVVDKPVINQQDDAARNHVQRKLSIDYGINMKESKINQYLVALDNKDGIFVVIKVPPFKKGQDPQAVIAGKDHGDLINAVNSHYTVIRQSLEMPRLHSNLENVISQSLTRTIFAGVLDEKNRIALSCILNGDFKIDHEQTKFVEQAITQFQKIVCLSKDEFERSRIVGEEVSITENRMCLSINPLQMKSLER